MLKIKKTLGVLLMGLLTLIIGCAEQNLKATLSTIPEYILIFLRDGARSAKKNGTK